MSDKDYQAVIVLPEVRKQKSQKNTMIYKKLFISTLLITIATHISYCNNNYLSYFDCFVQLEEDVLTVGNSKIERIFKFNNGYLITRYILNKETGFQWSAIDDTPDISFPGIIRRPGLGSFRTYIVEQTLSKEAYVEVGIIYKADQLSFKIDGLRIHNKLSELRVDSLFKKVQKELNNDAVINLDVTADKRFGYLYKSEIKVELESILREGGNFVAIIDVNGQIPFSLKNKNSYTLYKYKTIR